MTKFFDIFSGLFEGGVGNNMENKEDDVLRTKKAFSSTGHYKEPVENGILDRGLDTAIKNFQSENGLKIDGIMKKGGETERHLMVKTLRPPVPRRRPGWENPPIVNKAATREYILKRDLPAKFEIRDDGKGEAKSPFYEIEYFGNHAVKKYNKEIEVISKNHNTDPDLVRSVMWAENARGHYMGGNTLADKLRISDTVAPMNIDKNKWGHLVGSSEDIYSSPEKNIEAATILLKRIERRIDNPTPSKIGSIWNYAGRENLNDVGRAIGRAYRDKPWRK